jgi:release factor glutamine methyltransferase
VRRRCALARIIASDGKPDKLSTGDDWTVRRVLAQSGLVAIDAQVLLAHTLQRDRAWLAAHATDALARADVDRFFALAKRRRDGEPVAYLTGHRAFWNLDLVVTPAVLIPRPETETLVEAALARLAPSRPARVLDLGTGSGAVALALARERPDVEVLATDVSDAALAVAAGNATRLGVTNVRFARSDWYAHLPGDAGRFDAIVSNPPYVASGDPHLAQGDLPFEPRSALLAGPDGLSALRTIVAGASAWLAPSGWLLVEHGYDQAEAARALVQAAGFKMLVSLRDLAGIPRVAGGRLIGP